MNKWNIIVSGILIAALIPVATAYSYRGLLRDGRETEIWIRDYSTLPKQPQTGFKNVILQVDFSHTGTATYKNISFQAQTPPQLTAVRENFYISRMNPGNVFTTSYSFNINEDTEPGIYTVPIEVSYIDIQGRGDQKVTVVREAIITVSDKTRVEVSNIVQEEPVRPGEEFTTKVNIENIGYSPSNLLNLKLTIDQPGVYWERSTKTINYLLSGQQTQVEFKGKASNSIENGVYPATLTLNDGENIVNNTFMVTVQGEPRLTSAGIRTGEQAVTNRMVPVSLQIENIGKGDARAVSVELEEGEFEGSRTTQIGTIDEDGTGTAIFDISFRSPGEHPMTFEVTYLDEEGKENSVTMEGVIYVEKEQRNYSGVIALIAVVAIIGYSLHYYKKRKEQYREIDV